MRQNWVPGVGKRWETAPLQPLYAAPIAGAALFYAAVKDFENPNKDWSDATKSGCPNLSCGRRNGDISGPILPRKQRLVAQRTQQE